MAVDRRVTPAAWLPALFGPALLGLLALALSACAGTPAGGNANLSFTHLQPIRFNATEVQFVDNYRPTLAPPNVEHQYPQTPAAAVRDWTRARIAAAGAAGVVRVTVVEASVVEVRLPTREGVGGMFFNEENIRYDGAIEVTIDFIPRAGVTVGPSQARARTVRTQTMLESSTLNQRSTIYFNLLRGMMDDLDQQLGAAVRQYMQSALAQ